MGRVSLVALMGLLILATSASPGAAQSANVVEKPTSVDRVMVYSDRAIVTRSVEATDLKKGVVHVLFKDLPAAIQDASVRASVTGDNVRITGVEVSAYNLERPSEESTRKLQEDLQKLQDELTVINDASALLQEKIAGLQSFKQLYIQSLTKPAVTVREKDRVEERRTDLSIKDYGETMKAIQTDVEQTTVALRAEEVKRREIDKKMGFLQAELNKIGARQAQIAVRKAAKVSLEVAADGKAVVEIAYTSPSASWTPAYDIRVLPEKKEAELTGYAVVTQHSGEEWANAQISFSTAQLAISGWLPELPTLYATLPSPARPDLASSGFTGGNSFVVSQNKEILAKQQIYKFAPPANDPYPQEQGPAIAPVSTFAGVGSYTFRPEARMTIGGTGASHRIAILQKKVPMTFEYTTTPKITPHVYLQVSGKNTMTSPILCGELNVFSGGDFVSRSRADAILPEEEFELLLGVNENIRVTRKLEEKEEKGPGFLGSTKSVTWTFRIKIENFEKEKATVTIFDQLPVSSHKEVTIEPGTFSDKPIEQDAKTGRLKWKFEMKPRETKEIVFSFLVRVPSDKDPLFQGQPIYLQMEENRNVPGDRRQNDNYLRKK